jgi:hypothetical protein
VVVVDGEREEDQIVGENVDILRVPGRDGVKTSAPNGTAKISLEGVHPSIAFFA